MTTFLELKTIKWPPVIMCKNVLTSFSDKIFRKGVVVIVLSDDQMIKYIITRLSPNKQQ